MGIQYELQPLRITSGWKIEFNNFCECDPDNCDDFSDYFIEDLLQLQHTKCNLLIDLGWFPNMDENGQYCLWLIQNFNWEAPLELFKSRDRTAIINKIEYWTNYGFYNKYL